MLENLVYAQPGHLIRRAHQHAWLVFMEETKALDITPVQFTVLIALTDHSGADATRISELVAYDRATVGSVIDRLEKKGLLSRKPHSTDRRVKEIFLTAEGKRTANAVKRAMPRISKRTVEGLNTQEQKQLVRLLARLLEANSG